MTTTNPPPDPSCWRAGNRQTVTTCTPEDDAKPLIHCIGTQAGKQRRTVPRPA